MPSDRPPTFLVISGWQTVNIGDIAHTPGLLELLRTAFPGARFILWPKSVEGYGVSEMLQENFPNLTILPGTAGKDIALSPAAKEAMAAADMMIYGSGPGVMDLEKFYLWQQETRKPFGIMGVTVQSVWPDLQSVLEAAAFVLTRETASLQVVRDAGIAPERSGFFPDATFNIALQDEATATRFLAANGLEEKAFICLVPRLRYTPYHQIHDYIQWDEAKIQEVTAHNDRYKEQDHAKLREVIVRWVEETGHPVLLCPEMTYQVDIMDELLIDPLPAAIKPYVRKHPYWLTDEAASVYRRAVAVVSMECHSPIIALANGTPAFYLRQQEDTIKGQMYADLGLEDWVFPIDETGGQDLYARLSEVRQDQAATQVKIEGAFVRVKAQHAAGIARIALLLAG